MKTFLPNCSNGRGCVSSDMRSLFTKPGIRLVICQLIAVICVMVLSCRKNDEADQTPAESCAPSQAAVENPPVGEVSRQQPPLPVPPPSPNEWLFVGDAFEGTFVQLWQEHTTWTRERWEKEFSQLRRAGMKMVVVQWVQHDELDFTTPGPDLTSPLDRVVAAADTIGIDLCVGLSLRKSWWQVDSFRAPYMQEELARNRQLAARLYPLLRGHRCFYGWYIPHEITDIETGGESDGEVRSFFSELTKDLNAIDPLKPILASGYTDRDRAEIVHFVTWWTLFLKESGVDVLVFQDGAGLARKAPWKDIAPWIDALCTVAGEVGCDVWLVGEVFNQTHGKPIDDGGFQATPADIGRVRQQLDLLGKSKKRLLAYNYFDYMRPSASSAAATLFDEYVRLVDARAASRQSSSGAFHTTTADSEP